MNSLARHNKPLLLYAVIHLNFCMCQLKRKYKSSGCHQQNATPAAFLFHQITLSRQEVIFFPTERHCILFFLLFSMISVPTTSGGQGLHIDFSNNTHGYRAFDRGVTMLSQQRLLDPVK